MEIKGFEPLTSRMQSERSTTELNPQRYSISVTSRLSSFGCSMFVEFDLRFERAYKFVQSHIHVACRREQQYEVCRSTH